MFCRAVGPLAALGEEGWGTLGSCSRAGLPSPFQSNARDPGHKWGPVGFPSPASELAWPCLAQLSLAHLGLQAARGLAWETRTSHLLRGQKWNTDSWALFILKCEFHRGVSISFSGLTGCQFSKPVTYWFLSDTEEAPSASLRRKSLPWVVSSAKPA